MNISAMYRIYEKEKNTYNFPQSYSPVFGIHENAIKNTVLEILKTIMDADNIRHIKAETISDLMKAVNTILFVHNRNHNFLQVYNCCEKVIPTINEIWSGLKKEKVIDILAENFFTEV